MDKVKRAIKHELLNIFTALSLMVENLDQSKKNKNLENIIKLWSVLIWFEDILLGIKPKLINEKFVLNEVIESVLLINSDKIEVNCINSKLLKSESLLVNWDKYYVLDAIDFLFNVLSKSSSSIDFLIDSKNCRLIIEYNWDSISKSDFKNCMSDKWLDLNKILAKLAILIFDQMSINIIFKSNKILINFPN